MIMGLVIKTEVNVCEILEVNITSFALKCPLQQVTRVLFKGANLSFVLINIL